MKAHRKLLSIIISLLYFNIGSLYPQKNVGISSSIHLPQGFTAEPFYTGIPNPDGIAFRHDGSLLVVNESEPEGVFIATRGDTFDIGDAFSTTGSPFVSPDDLLLHPDGSVFVADGQARTLFKIPAEGGAPKAFVTSQPIGTSNGFVPWSIAIAPASFDGPNVDPGDLIIASTYRAVWAINPLTGEAKVIAQGSIFNADPQGVAFNPDGRLFVYQCTESNRIVRLDAEGSVLPFLSYVPDQGGFAIHPVTGDIYFGLQDNLREIWCIPGEGGYPRVFATGFPGRFQDMAFSPDGSTLFVCHPNALIEISGPFLEPMPSLEFALGSIAGDVTNVKDNTQCSNLEIVAHNGDKRVSSAQTDYKGRYKLMLLPGMYTVRPARGQGIKSSVEAILMVEAGKESTVDFTATTIELPDILKRSMSRYESLTAYCDTTSIELQMVKPSLDTRMNSTSLFLFKRPNRIRNESIIDSPIGEIELFSNGDKMVSYMGRWKQYTEEDAAELLDSDKLQMVHRSVALNSILSKDPLSTLRQNIEEVKEIGDENLDGNQVTVVEMIQPIGSLDAEMLPMKVDNDMLISVRLWIGSQDFLIKKVAYELDIDQIKKGMPEEEQDVMDDFFKGMKMRITEMHTGIEIDPVFSDMDFTFIPPEGAELVNKFSPPGTRPKSEESKIIGNPAPDFILNDIDGIEAKLTDFKGKVVLLDFWATWCGPCMKAMPHIQALSETYDEENVIILGINSWEREKDKLRPLLNEHKITYRVLLDSNDEVIQKYGVKAIPKFFVIDKEGIVRYSYTGLPAESQIVQQNIETLLAE